MDNNRPRSREKNVTGGGPGVHKRGSGLGTGPVGNSGRPGGSGGFHSTGGSGGGKAPLRAGGSLSIVVIIIILALKFMGGNGGSSSGVDVGSLLGGGSTTSSTGTSSSSSGSGFDLTSLLGGMSAYAGDGGSAAQSNWKPNTGKLDTSVAKEARTRYTDIKGNGKDKINLMVYMCGTDLESKSGMATADLQEMLGAKLSSNINLIVYTGGCKMWKNNVVSSDKNQIYQIKDGGLVCLEKDFGKDAMTKPATLTKFIQYVDKNFEANRNMLIFWDHGGGSLSGYGYDEKNASSGSMNLAGINTALKDAGIKYDFIGFDACLMATMENALMLTEYADYLIASEETEPGVGWYYTNWLTALSKDTSMATIEIGKNIIDDFVDVCGKKCPGQKTTLSIVDLAELEKTIPDKFKSFASATKDMIQNDQYKEVSTARNNTREFASSSKIDQVDLVHLAQNISGKEANALVKTIQSAVKYNRTSSNMTNANGISIYFPYRKVSKVTTAVSEYDRIDMDSEYADCIKLFAGMETSGQSAAPTAPYGGNSGTGSSLFDIVLSGLGSEVSGGSMDSSAVGMLTSLLGMKQARYVETTDFDESALYWTKDSDGQYKLKLAADQKDLIQDVALSVYYDDGEGYIDLGLDNVFDLDSKGDLIGSYDRTWLGINGQPVAYYYTETVEEGEHYSISGYVPALLNGQRVKLILIFDDANPYGYVAGAAADYKDGETETVAKSMMMVQAGDKIDFLCDYYSYSGIYQDSYYLGEQLVVGDTLTISNVDIGDGRASAMYRLTDLYQIHYWTPVIPE
ncbi:MAG: clostripain-related cysteine peptidase [Acetatifactor sp.]|nr:clostripain-related cysteine peptidase [Acetatifactor sp.]